MRIRKKYQVIPTNAKLENGYSTSDKNGYTCEYINKMSNYSETEQVVGKWIDNKPIYRKVIQIDVSDLTIGGAANYAHDISNLDTLVSINGTFKRADGNNEPLPLYTDTTSFRIQVYDISSTTIRMVIGSDYTGTRAITQMQLILEYTKTTD